MWRRRKLSAVVERTTVERPARLADDFPGGDEELFAEIDRLSGARPGPDPERDRRLLHLRHLAGIRLLLATDAEPEHPDPATGSLPASATLPEIPADRVTPELIRAGILRDGCLLVRGLLDPAAAATFAEEIDRAFVQRERAIAGEATVPGYYEPFEGHDPFVIEQDARDWVRVGGGVLAVDSPRLAAEMFGLFREAGLPDLVRGYLGEPPLISLQKTTLRKAEPSVVGAWHQDGAFMGDVRALNLWLPLSRCGDEAPGLDLVPRRLDRFIAPGGDEAVLDIQVSRAKAEEAAGDRPIIRPVFEAGDALFFDELFLHATGSDPRCRSRGTRSRAGSSEGLPSRPSTPPSRSSAARAGPRPGRRRRARRA